MTASFQTAIYTGEFGTATIPKVMSNMLTVVNIIALGEVMMIGIQLIRTDIEFGPIYENRFIKYGNKYIKGIVVIRL